MWRILWPLCCLLVSKKATGCLSLSIEAEYHALAMVVAKLYWLCMLLRNLCIPFTSPPLIQCDNVDALALASNPFFHTRTKHIELDYHFIREKVLNKDVELKFISTVDQVVDIFTKGLSSTRFLFLHDKLMVYLFSHQLAGK